MFETVRLETRKRLLSTVVIAVSLASFAAMVTLIAPGVIAEVDLDAVIGQLPSAVVESLGLEGLGTVEGFLAVEVYQFVWLVGLGTYVAYTAAGTIAGDIESHRMDTVLAAPVSRWRVVVEKFLALLTPIAVMNSVVYTAVYGSAIVVDAPLDAVDLGMVHLLSVPYLLACGAVGMVASVLTTRRLIAEGIGAGAIVGAFLLQSVVATTEYAWLGAIAPMWYYDPVTILTQSTYDLVGAAILLAATVGLLAVSAWRFTIQDIP